jgi:ABC-2 type transport system ATP-binding protein
VNQGTTILVSTHYMDEAERCHRLAILDRGRLVAEGPPKTLMAGIDAAVVEVETEEIEAARAALAGIPEIESTAQLGTRLRVLMTRSAADPAASVQRALGTAGVPGRAQLAVASLEDVFVTATGERRERREQRSNSEARP